MNKDYHYHYQTYELWSAGRGFTWELAKQYKLYLNRTYSAAGTQRCKWAALIRSVEGCRPVEECVKENAWILHEVPFGGRPTRKTLILSDEQVNAFVSNSDISLRTRYAAELQYTLPQLRVSELVKLGKWTPLVSKDMKAKAQTVFGDTDRWLMETANQRKYDSCYLSKRIKKAGAKHYGLNISIESFRHGA